MNKPDLFSNIRVTVMAVQLPKRIFLDRPVGMVESMNVFSGKTVYIERASG